MFVLLARGPPERSRGT